MPKPPTTLAPDPPRRRPSEAIRSLSWDEATTTLFVQFVSGETYAYLDVPARIYGAFLAAESQGRFFQAEVRDRYAHRRLPAG